MFCSYQTSQTIQEIRKRVGLFLFRYLGGSNIICLVLPLLFAFCLLFSGGPSFSASSTYFAPTSISLENGNSCAQTLKGDWPFLKDHTCPSEMECALSAQTNLYCRNPQCDTECLSLLNGAQGTQLLNTIGGQSISLTFNWAFPMFFASIVLLILFALLTIFGSANSSKVGEKTVCRINIGKVFLFSVLFQVCEILSFWLAWGIRAQKPLWIETALEKGYINSASEWSNPLSIEFCILFSILLLIKIAFDRQVLYRLYAFVMEKTFLLERQLQENVEPMCTTGCPDSPFGLRKMNKGDAKSFFGVQKKSKTDEYLEKIGFFLDNNITTVAQLVQIVLKYQNVKNSDAFFFGLIAVLEMIPWPQDETVSSVLIFVRDYIQRVSQEIGKLEKPQEVDSKKEPSNGHFPVFTNSKSSEDSPACIQAKNILFHCMKKLQEDKKQKKEEDVSGGSSEGSSSKPEILKKINDPSFLFKLISGKASSESINELKEQISKSQDTILASTPEVYRSIIKNFLSILEESSQDEKSSEKDEDKTTCTNSSISLDSEPSSNSDDPTTPECD